MNYNLNWQPNKALFLKLLCQSILSQQQVTESERKVKFYFLFYTLLRSTKVGYSHQLRKVKQANFKHQENSFLKTLHSQGRVAKLEEKFFWRLYFTLFLTSWGHPSTLLESSRCFSREYEFSTQHPHQAGSSQLPVTPAPGARTHSHTHKTHKNTKRKRVRKGWGRSNTVLMYESLEKLK